MFKMQYKSNPTKTGRHKEADVQVFLNTITLYCPWTSIRGKQLDGADLQSTA